MPAYLCEMRQRIQACQHIWLHCGLRLVMRSVYPHAECGTSMVNIPAQLSRGVHLRSGGGVASPGHTHALIVRFSRL